MKRWAIELSLRTIRLFHVDEVGSAGEQSENVGGVDDEDHEDDVEGARRSLLSVHVHDVEDNDERYGVERCFDP